MKRLVLFVVLIKTVTLSAATMGNGVNLYSEYRNDKDCVLRVTNCGHWSDGSDVYDTCKMELFVNDKQFAYFDTEAKMEQPSNLKTLIVKEKRLKSTSAGPVMVNQVATFKVQDVEKDVFSLVDNTVVSFDLEVEKKLSKNGKHSCKGMF